jgi:hypothetical protein
MIVIPWMQWGLIREPLGTSVLKVVAVGAVTKKSPQIYPSHKKTSRKETSEKKEREYTDSLFGMNSLNDREFR